MLHMSYQMGQIRVDEMVSQAAERRLGRQVTSPPQAPRRRARRIRVKRPLLSGRRSLSHG
jgi:hypothetical protein